MHRHFSDIQAVVALKGLKIKFQSHLCLRTRQDGQFSDGTKTNLEYYNATNFTLKDRMLCGPRGKMSEVESVVIDNMNLLLGSRHRTKSRLHYTRSNLPSGEDESSLPETRHCTASFSADSLHGTAHGSEV